MKITNLSDEIIISTLQKRLDEINTEKERVEVIFDKIRKEIQSAFEFVGHGIDQKGKEYSFKNNSILVQLLPTQIDAIAKSFPDFNVVPLGLNNYFTIGFNKKKI